MWILARFLNFFFNIIYYSNEIHTKFQKALLNWLKVMPLYGEFGWILTTGENFCLILFGFFFNIIYYSYKMDIQSFVRLCSGSASDWHCYNSSTCFLTCFLLFNYVSFICFSISFPSCAALLFLHSLMHSTLTHVKPT